MAARKATALVQLKVRLREKLRVQLQASAKINGVSLNQEIVDRLQNSFDSQPIVVMGEKLAVIMNFVREHAIRAEIAERDIGVLKTELGKYAARAHHAEEEVKVLGAALEARLQELAILREAGRERRQ